MRERCTVNGFAALTLILALAGGVCLGVAPRAPHARGQQGEHQPRVAIERAGDGGEEGASVGQPGARDESWARVGAPVQWQPAWEPANDPRKAPGFAEGGEFREIFEGEYSFLVPFKIDKVYSRRIADLVMEGLGTYDPVTLKLRGVLAEAWQYDPGGLWLRVKIRPEACFSDGNPVTAEDVRWTFHDFVMNAELDPSSERALLEPIVKEVLVIQDRVVEFRFHGANYSNLNLGLTMYVLPKHYYSRLEPAEVNRATGLLMGSGPFRLREAGAGRQWTPPDPTVLERNERYWGPRPPLDRLTFRSISNALGRVAEFKSDGADMVTPTAEQFETETQEEAWRRQYQNLNWVNIRSNRSMIIWNCGERTGRALPFADARVRRAMTHLVDRERMLREIWKGYGVVSKGYFNPDMLGYDADLTPWPWDVPKAVELLREAGWEKRGDGRLTDKGGNPFAFELTTAQADDTTKLIVEFLQRAFGAVGIAMSHRVDKDKLGRGSDVLRERDFDALLLAWGSNAPESDPRQMFHSSSIANGGDNYGQWSCAEADRAMDAARAEVNDQKREALWKEFGRVVHREQPYTWLRVMPWLRFVNKDIRNVHMYPKGLEYTEFFRARPEEGKRD